MSSCPYSIKFTINRDTRRALRAYENYDDDDDDDISILHHSDFSLIS